MLFKLNVITSLFAIVPALAGWIRLRYIQPNFNPFIVVLTLGFFNELVSLLLIYKTGSNVVSYNIYVLLSSWLILWQFYKWRPHSNLHSICTTGALLLSIIWLFEWVFQKTLSSYFSQSILFRNAIIAFLSMYFIGRRLLIITYKIYRDAVFLICTGWLIRSIHGFITELLLLYGWQQQAPVLYYLIPIFSIFNFLVLLIHTFAIQCTPPKIPY